jgi:transcriptional regulator with XRE-family HTH domain
MALLSVIRRWALRDQLSIREIAGRTGLSRNTIRKYLRSGTVEPAFKVSERPSKLDPFADKLLAWLKTEAGKSRKKRRTLKQLHADLVALGYAGSYGRVAAFARKWKADRQREEQSAGRGTFVPLVFRPGEAFQFDWSEDWATIAGENTKLQVAHIKLSHSRAFLLRAYLLQTMRCCSMPTGTPSGSSAAFPGGASTTSSHCCAIGPSDNGEGRPRWTGSAPARRVKSTPGSWR